MMQVYNRCTEIARELAKVGLADLLPHTAGVGQVLKGVLPLGLPFLGGWGASIKGLARKAAGALRLF